LYKRRLNGEIPSFTGVSDPYDRLQTRKSASIHPREEIDASVEEGLAEADRLGYYD